MNSRGPVGRAEARAGHGLATGARLNFCLRSTGSDLAPLTTQECPSGKRCHYMVYDSSCADGFRHGRPQRLHGGLSLKYQRWINFLTIFKMCHDIYSCHAWSLEGQVSIDSTSFTAEDEGRHGVVTAVRLGGDQSASSSTPGAVDQPATDGRPSVTLGAQQDALRYVARLEETRMDGPPTEVPSELVDLTHISLADLEIEDGSILARSIQRLLREAARPDEAIAGFNSSI
jgi:FXSXX-COOH protein